MKKITFIILGLISIILLSVWAYMLFVYTPSEEGGFFADFGWFANQDVTPIEVLPPVVEEVPLVNVEGPRLRQLTTKPVAGYVEVYSTSSEPYFVRYVEAGLGHVYEINMETGEEIRVSNTTIPQANKAEFSSNGTHVAIQADVTARNTITVGNIADGEFSGQTLPTSVTDFTFSDADELYYSEVATGGADTLGKSLNLTTNTTRELFTIPFRSTSIGWAKDGRTSHYTYTKPAPLLLGYMYSISGDTIQREPITGNGLNVIANDDYIVYTRREGEQNITYSYSRDTGLKTELAVVAIPEKCIFSTVESEKGVLYCAFTMDFYDHKFIDEWYKGVRSFSDVVWKIDLNNGSAQNILPKNSSSQAIDIQSIQYSNKTMTLYFINKNNKTLWAYDLTY